MNKQTADEDRKCGIALSELTRAYAAGVICWTQAENTKQPDVYGTKRSGQYLAANDSVVISEFVNADTRALNKSIWSGLEDKTVLQHRRQRGRNKWITTATVMSKSAVDLQLNGLQTTLGQVEGLKESNRAAGAFGPAYQQLHLPSGINWC